METWEEAIVGARGGREYVAYRASTYHRDLFEKYRKAASRPWLFVEADPPPPPMASPRLDADASYTQAVRDRDKPIPLPGDFK